MEKEYLKECIDNNMSINQIGEIVNKSKSTISYWLKKHNLKTNHESRINGGTKNYGNERCCTKCSQTKPLDEFYDRRGKKGSSVYCKVCTIEQSLIRQRELKQQAIDYKGGCCEVCGYNKYNGALEFHHADPSEKDFSISSLKNYKFTDKIKIELDKCVLLCSNCHREVHGGVITF